MINGVENQDLQSSTRYGITLSVPLAAQWSTKLAWSRGLSTRIGGNFQTVAVALQYRWFNRWLNVETLGLATIRATTGALLQGSATCRAETRTCPTSADGRGP
jgi:hypothetical protein